MRSRSVPLTRREARAFGSPRFVFARGTRHGRLRGRLTGGSRVCPLEGCPGARLGVRWPDGRLTWPCTKGMILCADGHWEID